MANLRVDLNEPLLNGMDITFKAPCDCTAVTGLIVYAPDNEGAVSSRTFTFKDAHGNALNGVGNLFETNALVKVMVDLDTSSAYLLNADTNKYLEEKIANAGTKVTLSSSVSSTSTTTAANSYAVKQAYDKAVSAQNTANAALTAANGDTGVFPTPSRVDGSFTSKTFDIRWERHGNAVTVTGTMRFESEGESMAWVSFANCMPRALGAAGAFAVTLVDSDGYPVTCRAWSDGTSAGYTNLTMLFNLDRNGNSMSGTRTLYLYFSYLSD